MYTKAMTFLSLMCCAPVCASARWSAICGDGALRCHGEVEYMDPEFARVTRAAAGTGDVLHLVKKYHMSQCVCYNEGTLQQLSDTFHTHAKNKINSLRNSQPQIPSKEACASSRPSEIYTKQRGANKKNRKPSSRQGHKLFKTVPSLQARLHT